MKLYLLYLYQNQLILLHFKPVQSVLQIASETRHFHTDYLDYLELHRLFRREQYQYILVLIWQMYFHS